MQNNLDNLTVKNIRDVRIIVMKKGTTAKISERYCFGFSFCLQGRIVYTHSKNDFISDRNSVMILPQGESYTLRCEESGSFALINFDCSEAFCHTHVPIPYSKPETIWRIFETMRQLSLFGGSRAKLMSMFYEIISHVSAPPAFGLAAEAVRYIIENFSDHTLDNTGIAEHFHISEVYLRKLFKREYNTTPRQFLIDTRINMAKHILLEQSIKISSAAELCGFQSPYHFCKCFRQHVGVTPTEYIMKRSNRGI